MDDLFEAIEIEGGPTAADDDFAPGDTCYTCADLGCADCGRA